MPPFVQPVEQTIHTENEILDGYIVELLRHLSNTVPFTFDLQKVKDGDGMGRRHRDGSYSGILGELIRKVSAVQMVTHTPRNPLHLVLLHLYPFLAEICVLKIQPEKNSLPNRKTLNFRNTEYSFRYLMDNTEN